MSIFRNRKPERRPGEQGLTGCHGAADLSPVTMAAAVHLGISTHNAAIQEYSRVPGDSPGLGVDIDEAAAARFEYRRAYLPVSRLADGTVGNW